MKSCKLFLEYLQRTLPDLSTPKDLVKAGIYNSSQGAYSARKKGNCPPYFHIPQRGIVYPKQPLIEFLEKHSWEPKP